MKTQLAGFIPTELPYLIENVGEVVTARLLSTLQSRLVLIKVISYEAVPLRTPRSALAFPDIAVPNCDKPGELRI